MKEQDGSKTTFLSWDIADWHDAGPGPLAVPDGYIDVWRIALFDPVAAVEPVSCAEWRQAQKFHFEKDRLAFLAARAARRLILARYTGLAAESLIYDVGPNGKPSLSDQTGAAARPVFNLTRLGTRWALLGIAKEGCLGLDGEMIVGADDFKLVAETHFPPEESGYLDGPDEAGQFFSLWTAKEALIKATGDGLSVALDSFTVSNATSRPRLIAGQPPFTPDTWWLYRFAPVSQSIATLAINQEIRGIRSFQFNNPSG